MSINFRKLESKDVPFLIKLRLAQLQEAGIEQTPELQCSLQEYYRSHRQNDTFRAWLAVDDAKIVATCGICFVEKPPYYGNLSGKIGLLANIYTLKEYRRQGISRKLLDKVVAEARAYGCGTIQATASAMGILLYTDYGFKKNDNFAELNL